MNNNSKSNTPKLNIDFLNDYNINNQTFNKYLNFIFDNIQCSYCNEYQNISHKDNNENKEEENIEYINWNLYLKEFEDYSAFILYHNVYKKDVIELFKKYNFKIMNELTLYDITNNNRFITLEFVSKNEDENTSIWVPSENDIKLYERIIESNKKYDKNMEAYLIGTFNIKNL